MASVIVVALKGMLIQVTDFYRFWKLSKIDALVWLMTFLTVVFISIDVGLFAGLLMSVLTIMYLGFKPYTCLLGSVPHTDIYLDLTRYKMVLIPYIFSSTRVVNSFHLRVLGKRIRRNKNISLSRRG